MNWHLYEGAVGTFHVGYRVDVKFASADESESFEQEVSDLVLRAKEEVLRLRAKFLTLSDAVSHYRDYARRSCWDDYHYGVFLALSGDVASAKMAFQAVSLHLRPAIGWQKALAQRASELHDLMVNRPAFLETMRGIVLRTRSIGNLPEWERELVLTELP